MLSSLEQFQSFPVISSFFDKGLHLDCSGIGMFKKSNSSNATLPTMFFTFTTVTLVLADFRPFPRFSPKKRRQIGGVEAFLEGFNDINLSQMLAQHKVHLMTKKVEVWMCWGAGWTWWIDKLKLRFGHKISCKKGLRKSPIRTRQCWADIHDALPLQLHQTDPSHTSRRRMFMLFGAVMMESSYSVFHGRYDSRLHSSLLSI